jgi:SNF2 family DNA or RNA helicase
MPTHLRNYQDVGVEFLVDRRNALLADEMGLGKTAQVIRALAKLRRGGFLATTLIVVPASLRPNWNRELKKWWPNASVGNVQGTANDRRSWYALPYSVLIVSFEQVRADFLVEPPEREFGVVVVDEAQRVKDAASATTIALSRVRRERLWLMTATPLENRTADLETLVRLFDAKSLPANPSLEVLHEALQGRFLRRRKADVVSELPPIIEQQVSITLTTLQRQEYESVHQRGLLQQSGNYMANMFSLLTELKQICNFGPTSNESGKLDALRLILDGVTAEGGKLLLFSQYVQTLEWLSPRLGIASSMIHGGVGFDDRQTILDEFDRATGPSVLLMSLRAGGVGLNIPSATHVVLYDRWWNPAVEDQAIARAHRLGRRIPLTAYRFLAVDTVEERINEILIEKRDLFEDYVEDAPSADSLDVNTLRRILKFEATGSDPTTGVA